MNTFDDDNTIEPIVIIPEPAPKPAPVVDVEVALSQVVDNVKSQLADSKKIAAKLTEQTVAFDKFGKQADNFFNKLHEELHTAIDKNFAQFGKEIEAGFKEQFKQSISAGVAEIKQLNDGNVQKLIDRAVKKNDMSFYLIAAFGLISSVIGCVGYDLILHNHKYSLWIAIPTAILAFIGLTYYADHRANK